jgi:hypothetical protein
MKPQQNPVDDDDSIANDDVLYRSCKTPHQVALNRGTGLYELSPQIFSPLKGGCSIEFKSLLDGANETPETRSAAQNNIFSVVAVTAEVVRNLEFKTGSPPVPGQLKIAYTPIPEEDDDGPNPYHGDIFPVTQSANIALTTKRVIVIDIDQAKAAEAYARRNGKKA